jgi:MFS family permease
LKNHPLVTTLLNLRGNVRACVYTEPLWGIPYNLYAPYASVYMLAFGLKDSQIGLITSINMVFQIFWTLMSGAITDKLGRKRATLIFDILCWTIPCFIWAIAQNFTYFLIAAIINSIFRVTHNSWQCLLVEDSDPKLLVDVYSWIYIAGLLSAFVSPLTGLLIAKFTLIPTIRGLYLLAVVLMTTKFVVLNALATETKQGLIRMQETKHQSIWFVVGETRDVLKDVLHHAPTLFIAGLMLIVNICNTINGTFWSILVTKKLLIPPEHLAIYPFVKSITMLLFFFLVMPKLRLLDVRKPMIAGFCGFAVSQVLLISMPPHSYGWLLVATILEACSVPATSTLLDKFVMVTIDPQERARIMAILLLIMIILTSPFGWVAGQLSEINYSLPFVLNIILFAVGGFLTFLAK